jgi:hypothetical protein
MTRTLAATAATIGAFLLVTGCVAGALGATSPPGVGTTGTTGATGPVAAGPVVASLDANVPIAAGGGWIVWSVPIVGGYGLYGSHDGVTAPLPVAPRPQPFDASVGTSATGTPVVTFSRCQTTPTRPPIGLGSIAPLTGSGCRIHVFNLGTRKENMPAIPHPTGTSDTTPAIWHGQIAFAREDPRHHQAVQQVLLWKPGHRRLESLPHGAVPACPERQGCAGQPRSGSVEGLAYDGKLVSFLWEPDATGVFGDAGWEVRADSVATGRSRLVGSGVAGEVCMGGPDENAPSPPVLTGDTVRFDSLQADCYIFGSTLWQINLGSSGDGIYGTVPGIVLGLAADGSALYALEAPTPSDETNPTCTVAAPCQIQQITPPDSQPARHKPDEPF